MIKKYYEKRNVNIIFGVILMIKKIDEALPDTTQQPETDLPEPSHYDDSGEPMYSLKDFLDHFDLSLNKLINIVKAAK